MQFLYDGAWNKRFHTGYAAMNGLIAATAAAEGQRGAAQALEGQAGFLHAYSPAAQVERVTTSLGTEFETLSIAVKPYPACRYSHAALDALIGLAEQYDIDANDVSAVEVGLPSTGHKIIGEPLSAKQRPHNIVDGQFSMPFVGAVALRERGLAWDDYARHLSNPATLALCKKIRTVVDPAVEAEYPSNMSASVRVDTSGNRYEQLVVVPKGEPSNFMSDAELLNKFGLLVDPYLDHAQRDKLSTTLLLLDHAENITELLALSCPPTQARSHS